ncbi:MAG: VWA domain-containing protein, partial [Acidobacteriota bacterium]|nr:VWA domain-containing protein [Acidobacteriota bacterium]
KPVATDAQDITERTTDDVNRIATGGKYTPHMREVSPRVTNITNNSAEFRQSSFAVATLGTINYTINGMRGLPGRKTIMLFSDGIKIFSAEKSSFADAVRLGMQKLIDLANRSSVVIYSVDTKGLGNLGLQASDSTTELRPDQIDKKVAERESDFYNSQEGLVYLAEQTGGKAYLNNNDLNYGLRRVLEDETGYYLIGYQPESDTFNSEKLKFNKIEIKVKRANLKVSYRSGFFNTLNEAQKSESQTAQQKITKALTSPFSSNEIGLKLNASFADDADEGSYIRSLLHIDAKDLKFSTDAEGWQKATFDAVAVAFGSDGVPVEQTAKTYTIKVKGATYQTMLDKGFVYTLILPVKRAGVYQLRTVLRDTNSDKVGSAGQFIKVPVLKKETVTLSNLSLENLTPAQWQSLQQSKTPVQVTAAEQNEAVASSLYDTTLRQFKRGTYLRYGFEIYNAKVDKSQNAPQLTMQMKLLRNGKTFVEGKTLPVKTNGQTDFTHLRTTGAIILKNEFEPGDYVLEVTVTDNFSKQTATQWINFSIVE